MKLCIDCKHFTTMGFTNDCGACSFEREPKSSDYINPVINPVNGKPLIRDAMIARHNANQCGMEARWFEAKDNSHQ